MYRASLPPSSSPQPPRDAPIISPHITVSKSSPKSESRALAKRMGLSPAEASPSTPATASAEEDGCGSCAEPREMAASVDSGGEAPVYLDDDQASADGSDKGGRSEGGGGYAVPAMPETPSRIHRPEGLTLTGLEGLEGGTPGARGSLGTAGGSAPATPDTPCFAEFLDFINKGEKKEGAAEGAKDEAEAEGEARAEIEAEAEGGEPSEGPMIPLSPTAGEDAGDAPPAGDDAAAAAVAAVPSAAPPQDFPGANLGQDFPGVDLGAAPPSAAPPPPPAMHSSEELARPSPAQATSPKSIGSAASSKNGPPVYGNRIYDRSRRFSSCMADFVSANDTKARVGKRCYRLNLERPFDIHCEQSPLEYGDYMAPWTKEVYPATVGPTEYCPPRHLGGEGAVWRELMRWSEAAAFQAAQDEDVEERKVNSLDEVEGGTGGLKVDADAGDAQEASGVMEAHSVATGIVSPGGGVYLSGEGEEEKVGSADEIEKPPITGKVEESPKDDSKAAAAPATSAAVRGIGGSGWRKLSPAEEVAVAKLADHNSRGEYAFLTYDLSHVWLNTMTGVLRDAGDNIVKSAGDPSKGPIASEDEGDCGGLRTVFSMDSTTSEDERANPRTPEEMADDTARLFRRSELSLREAAEKKEKEEAERRERERREEIERQEREKQRRQNSGGLDGSEHLSKSGRRMRGRRGSAKLLRNMSSGMKAAMNSVQGTPSQNMDGSASWRGSSSRRHSSSSVSGRNTGLVKRSSMQALQIDKARDLVDESDDEGSVVGAAEGEGDEASKKPLNVSLYVLGEYDILNDLANDGAKRLRDNKESSDLDLLLQNDPCPPPNRWVRSTGWSKCNPGSVYARVPPEDFDWERYNDKLRLKTSPKGPPSHDMRPGTAKGSNATQGTEVTAAVSGSGSLDRQQPPPRRTSLPPPRPGAPARAGTDDLSKSARTPSARPPIATRAVTDDLSKSARAPRARPATADRAVSDSLSQSARTPRAGTKASYRNSASLSSSARTSSSGSGSKKKSFGRKMSNIFKSK